MGLRKSERFYEPLRIAFFQYGVTTALRQAHFLAQALHETGGLTYLEEIWWPTPAQRRYDPPWPKALELGNFRKGDGYRYRGRGIFQLTGRGNYRRAYQRIRRLWPDCPDFEGYPERVAEPFWAAITAGDYWASRGLNSRADRDDLIAVTRGVNGGLNGYLDRLEWLKRAKKALGVET